VRSWWWIVGVGTIALLAGTVGLTVLFAAVSIQAFREFVRTAPDAPALRGQSAVAVYVFVPLQYALILSGERIAILVALPALMSLMGLLRAGGVPKGQRGHRLDSLTVAAAVCIYGMSFTLAPLWLCPSTNAGERIGLIYFLVTITQASDVLQYLWGKAIGRHRVAPTVSPGKTVEGLLGGVTSSLLLGAAIAPEFGIGRFHGMLLATLIAMAGIVGGLLLSAIKRRRGIKDWGALLPGHGGVLDRVDSLWLSAPVFSAALAYLQAGSR
jgi:phosphatidate cytidylyltransferase